MHRIPRRPLLRAMSICTNFADPPPPSRRVLIEGTGVNQHIARMQYAVRGELVLRAEALENTLRNQSCPNSLPFDRIIYCNIGNPQSVGQAPITFVRQVLAAVVCPALVEKPDSQVFPSDVVHRVRDFLHQSHGVGAYTESRGLPFVRERVAEAIKQRDGGIVCNPDNLYLTNGASEAVKTMLSLIIRGPADGVLIPIPQYPLYSATMTALNGVQVGYYLDEDKDWSLSIADLEKRLKEAQHKGITVRAIVIINPGNPTGQVLSRANMEDVVQFCEQKNIVIMADEVYQKNVYIDEKPFTSFKKVLADLGSNVELASFHSISKGVMGECGLRGGYMEVVNMEQYTTALLYKALSVSLCSNVVGQLAIDLMMTPPKPGEPSYHLYNTEVTNIYESLRRKAIALSNGLNTFKGVSCNRSEGAMYLFPKITMPDRAITEANQRGMASPDVLYCIELLEATGICVVPGSGFGQMDGTYHFRTTFLPPENQISDVIEKMRKFHNQFLLQYS